MLKQQLLGAKQMHLQQPVVLQEGKFRIT